MGTSALCSASWLLRLRLWGPDLIATRCELAPTAALESMAISIFGPPRRGLPELEADECGPSPLALKLLEWLLVATCPKPFSEEALTMAKASGAITAGLTNAKAS